MTATALPDWDPCVGWDEAEEGRPAPDCAAGLWLAASLWKPEHGRPDGNGYLKPPPGIRCVGCATELSPVYAELIAPAYGSDGQHYHCAHCACYLDDPEG